MKSLLITGGSGFIGSHTCFVLLKAGYNLIVFDSLCNSSIESLKRVSILAGLKEGLSSNRLQFIKGDIRNSSDLEKIFKTAIQEENPIYGVVHFAGVKSVSESVAEPLKYWDINVNGSRVLLEVMEKYNCNLIVFSSSATIYGYPSEIPITESSEVNPINPYGNTKAVVEKMLLDLFSSRPGKWKIANLRYFNPVGAHPSGQIGEDPLDIPNNLFPYLTQVAMGRREKLKIYGNDWPTHDGTGVRDYIHVMDLAEGHCAALDYLLNNKSQYLTLNIGTGRGVSVLEMIKTFEKVNQCIIPHVFVDRRPGDPPINIANNQLAISKLGWSTKRSLDEMCRDGWKWQTLNPFGYSKNEKKL